MREFTLKDNLLTGGELKIKCQDDHDCVFCNHCKDIFWDYSNLIYMIICDLNLDPWKRPCKHFKEEDI